MVRNNDSGILNPYKFPVYERDRFMENSSNSQFENSGAWQRPSTGKLIQIWTRFPEIGPAHVRPDIVQKLNRYSQKNDGWIFQNSVQTLKFRKNTGWVFQDLPIRVKLLMKTGCLIFWKIWEIKNENKFYASYFRNSEMGILYFEWD